MSAHGLDRESPNFFLGSEDVELRHQMKPQEFEDFDQDEEYDSPPERQIMVGICAMAKKSKSKPMSEILGRLCRFKYITTVIFEEDIIQNQPVEQWPLCDCLISFHSKGSSFVMHLMSERTLFNVLVQLGLFAHVLGFLRLSAFTDFKE
ncbi:hypothetical protein scyTo_0022412 [Scyliorhinus torazame]|uniref:VIP1 N-terminal domain-containing protein n=1 Tax=Scyliorhinus torazame TaxID=75743 RepID=A0A401Q626_SCYTO|nr:hypothetical protein [Scyliorhinus torazame]